jgi:hypothetical protein
VTVQTPTGGETEVLAALWSLAAHAAVAPGAAAAFRLSQIHAEVNRRRKSSGQHEVPLSSISGYLRSSLAKGFLTECRLVEDQVVELPPGARNPLQGSTRSPNTAYQPNVQPGDVFESMYRALIEAYPSESRPLRPLLDMAAAAGLEPKNLQELESWLQKRLSAKKR